jgi:hypothetical protein
MLSIKIQSILFYLLTPLVLLIPAFYNGYPLVYSDSGTYIRSGIELILPPDRPIMYGLLIQSVDFNFTLWPIIYIQAFLVNLILWKLIALVTDKFSHKKYLLFIIPLSYLSSLGWYTSQIMPDIFTFIAVGSSILLFLQKKQRLWKKVLYSLIIIVSINVHFSNFPIVFITMIIMFIVLKWKKILLVKYSIITPMIALFSSIICGIFINLAIGNTTKINQGSHVYLMGKMIDSGVLKSFLDDNCQTNKYIFCACKDSLPIDNRDLLWNYNGPLYQHGGWEKTAKPYNQILIAILKSPKHFSLFLYNSFIATATQLFQNNLGSGLESNYFRQMDSPPSIEINKHYQFELNQYLQSRQNGNLWGQELNLETPNLIQNILFYISSFFILMFFLSKRIRAILSLNLKVLVVFLLFSVLSNALVVSFLANTYDRLQSRISWVIIFSFMLIVVLHGKKIGQFLFGKISIFADSRKIE